MHRLFQWIKREFLHVFPVFVFFFLAFFIINTTERFLMIQAGFTPFTILDVFIAAAVIAKVLLVIDHLPGVELSSQKPLITRILWKTFVYWSITLIVRLCIRLSPFLHEKPSIHLDFSEFLEVMNWNLFISIQIWYLMLFFLFVTGRSLAIALGKAKMRQIFLGRK